MIDLNKYFENYSNLIKKGNIINDLEFIGKKLEVQKKNKDRVLFFGNGASSSIAGHAALDFTKQGGLRSICFHDPALLTAFGNDFGYENAFSEIIKHYYRENDIVIFISVSGESPNIINALETAKDLGLYTIGFSGKSKSNSLSMGASFSFWVDSNAYNIVENIHSAWLLSLCDYIIGKSEYEVS